MAESKQFLVAAGHPPERLDRYLAAQFADLTRAQIKRLIDDGRVVLAGTPLKAAYKLRGGELLSVTLPDPVVAEALPEELPLDIIYQDSDLIVVDKPAGMVVHPAPGHSSGTLVNALLYHCHDLAGIGGELRPGIVHRIDKETSGLLVATKNDQAHQSLAAQFKEHSIARRYLALAHGLLKGESGTIDQAIGRHPVERKKMSSRSRQGRRAVTHWKVLQRFEADRLSWLELRLETGRTHQIRVHMAEMQHPLVGDPVYGSARQTRAISDPVLRRMVKDLDRQALHARLLGFRHPRSGEWLEFSSEPPADMARIIDYLQQKTDP